MEYTDRFDPQHYEDGEVVEVRAYRRQRRASVYREHVVNEELFTRALPLGRAYLLHQLRSLDGRGPTELNKLQARRSSTASAVRRDVPANAFAPSHPPERQKACLRHRPAVMYYRSSRTSIRAAGDGMPRYVIERDFGQVSEDEMQEVAAKSKVTGADHFPDIRWEHSHVCAGEDGAIKSFCIYEAPGADRLQEHADRVGGHEVTRIYEIVGDITPEEVKV